MATLILHSELAWEVTNNPQFYIFYHLPLEIPWETEFTQINYGPVIHTNPPVEGHYEFTLGQQMIENPLRIKFKEVLNQSKSYDKFHASDLRDAASRRVACSPKDAKGTGPEGPNTMLGDKELKKIIEELKKFA